MKSVDSMIQKDAFTSVRFKIMIDQENQIVFDSKTGWYFESLTYRPRHGTEAEVLFHDRGSRKLYLELRGIRSPQVLLDVLDGFDDFHVIELLTGTPFAEHGRFLCRFYIDDAKYETVIDEYEAYETGTGPSPRCDSLKAAPQE